MKSVRKRAQEMIERIFFREQLKKKDYLKKQQRENKEKSQHSNRDSLQSNIPEHHKGKILFGHVRRRRQRIVGTAPVAE